MFCTKNKMISLEVNESVIVQQQELLESLLASNPKTEKEFRKLIRKAIMVARADVVEAAGRAMKSDPRGAARAVRTAVYKKILGANINIYNSRKTHGTANYTPPRTLKTGQRGGNRKVRTFRDMGKYAPLDRGFILRWINDGMTKTNLRVIDFKENDKRKVDKWNKHPNTGNRGAISARNFFRGAGERALVKAADILANLIDKELEDMLNKKK
jgi:hypothetical protein